MPYVLTFFPLLLSWESFSMYSVPCCPYFPSWVDLGQCSDQKVHQGEFTPVISGVKVLSVVCCTLNNNHIKDSTGRTLTLWLLSPITAWNENILLMSGKELQVNKNLPRKELLANRVTVGLCSHVTGGRRSPSLPSLTFLTASVQQEWGFGCGRALSGWCGWWSSCTRGVVKARKACCLYQDHLHEEGRVDYSWRWLPSEGSRGSCMPDRHSW